MLRKNLEDLEKNGRLGDWCFTDGDKSIWLRYPDPNEVWKNSLPDEQKPILEEYPITGEIVHLYVTSAQTPNDQKPAWEWDGNKEAPTLSPSINVIGRWHGYLRNGKLETA